MRRLVQEQHGDAVRVERIAYGPESAFLPPRDPEPMPAAIAALAPATAPLVVCVARNHSRKGVDVLIDALALARDRGVRLRACLIGGGPLLDENRRRATARGLDGSVLVAGFVPDVEPYLQHADVFALPSREEQSGALAILEALRVGLLVVASAVDGIPEDVTDGDTALLVLPDDPDAMARALMRLVVDAELRKWLAAAGAQRFATRFAADPVAAAVRRAYQALGAGPPR